MKKIRSDALWKYLSEKGVLNGTEAEILTAKREYRKLYKKQWKERRLKRIELRPGFTLKEFEIIAAQAKRVALKPTTFARQIILAAASQTEVIPNKYILLKVLQYISITAIELSKTNADKRILDPVETAEKMLLQYLFHNDSQANAPASSGL